MRVKYSPDFKKSYEQQPDAIKTRFMLADTLIVGGNLKAMQQQGWMYFVNLGPAHAAFGSLKDNDEVFYWIFIGSQKNLPVIL